ncbi:hypothetical protein GX865_01275 [Candidatus Saccharibacteria bacterium]|nr:hypothetical protein [Candidatus Saccharibacteria bacterium]
MARQSSRQNKLAKLYDKLSRLNLERSYVQFYLAKLDKSRARMGYSGYYIASKDTYGIAKASRLREINCEIDETERKIRKLRSRIAQDME